MEIFFGAKRLLRVVLIFAVAFSLESASGATSDPGVDYGNVVQATALFSGPSSDSQRISTLEVGDIMYLADPDATGGWYNVVQFSTGREGWVLGTRIHITKTTHQRYDLSLSCASGVTGDSPVIGVTNGTNENIYFHLGSSVEQLISPNATVKITTPEGLYNCNVSAPDMVPYFGHIALCDGNVFTDTFVISKSSNSSAPPSPALLSDFTINQNMVIVLKPQLDALQPLLANQEANVDQLHAAYQSDSNLVDNERQTLDQTDQAAVDAFNQLVDKTNDELASFNAANQDCSSAADSYNAKVDEYNRYLTQMKKDQDAINSD